MSTTTTQSTGGQQEQARRPRLASFIRRYAALIIVGWVGLTVFLMATVPPLEVVERQRSVSLNPADAPSFKASQRMGEVFQESTGGSVAILVVEGEDRLGEEAHRYYNEVVRQLREDPEHIQHVHDFWGDPLTAAAAESADGKAAFVQLDLAGTIGQTQSLESVEAVKEILDRTPPPPGVTTYLTGPAPIVADMGESGNRTVVLITLVTVGVIFLMLLFLYRSVLVVIILLFTVAIELQVARGVVAWLALQGWVGLTTYVVNLLVSVGIAAGTDYAIFFAGRYQEAREAGESREQAFFTTYRSVAKVVLASGMTIAGAIACLSFTRLPFFQPLGIPGAIGIGVAVAVALTLVPACLAVGSRFGLFDPKRPVVTRRWRRIGTAIVRWPGPILVAATAVALVGLITLPGYKPSYNDQKFLPPDIPANAGFHAAARHFPESRLVAPDILMIESDHDMRNAADLLVLNRLAKAVFAVPGVANVQSITRPEGTQLKHASIPFMLSMSQASNKLVMPIQRERMDDLLKQAEEMEQSIALMRRMHELMQEMVGVSHNLVENTHEIDEITTELRDHLANFDDFFRPIRNYFYWEPHCYNIPICWALRSLFETIDGVDRITVEMKDVIDDLDRLDALMPQMLAQLPPMIATMESTRTMMLTMHSTMAGIFAQMDESNDNATAMGKAFDAANNDDSFYLPPDVFDNEDFKRIVNIFMSPDGRAARFLITHKNDPGTPEGTALVEPIRTAAEEALKGTPLENSKIYLSGTAALVKDLVDGSKIDLMIAGVSALCLIFLIMVLMTRSFVAALVIVGTVAMSLGASFGLSVLVWQYLLGIQIHWVVLAMSVIVLLAVGSDYNLLLVSRMKEEVSAGINTGLIRAMGSSGKVVTAAGLVFAATMASMVVSDLLTIGQVGTTIALGLLFDTMVVRAFMTPSIAALLGRWFWWPRQVRPRPASAMLRPTGPRPLVRSLMLRD
ncbi:transport family protein [Mycolicibacterium hassiacum DSM 44199]|uniref:Transport family protein n=1 Tax=Mycolicibacterium hassiacum (strain DSM 44199 / CIP 105218 / JCM 12690 / 3849) TaxID=1122247 RepID=K5BDS5_MYCHD|nr:RND family transporter [Mycolicibacterium hassiacum]EKF22387.1 transport family protein [Mycolicibacterium hassiacum DSM 44199]MBX5487803.1 RND family transporter [Mycolicibacterium hassiacum]MDA4087597.1 membrane protein [Mycolicibacterium hassiacum DSM 44199]VCT91771.1 Siderophore exporter MmpL4 [Mycolicibacterium hassiacum DSM 44199]